MWLNGAEEWIALLPAFWLDSAFGIHDGLGFRVWNNGRQTGSKRPKVSSYINPSTTGFRQGAYAESKMEGSSF